MAGEKANKTMPLLLEKKDIAQFFVLPSTKTWVMVTNLLLFVK